MLTIDKVKYDSFITLYQHPLALPKPPEPGENIVGEEDKNSPPGNEPTSEEE